MNIFRILFLFFFASLLIACKEESIGQRVVIGPNKIDISAVYPEIFQDPITKTTYAQPVFFRELDKWIAFVPLIGKVIVMDSLGNKQYEGIFSERINENIIKDACLNAQVYNGNLHLFYNDAIIKLDLDKFTTDTIPFSSPYPVYKENEFYFLGDQGFIYSGYVKSKENSVFGIYLKDLKSGEYNKIFENTIDSLPNPFILFKPFGDKFATIRLDETKVVLYNFDSKYFKEIDFPNPEGYRFIPTPAYDQNEISIAFSKLSSDRFGDFHLSDTALFIQMEIYSRDLNKKLDFETFVFYHNIKNGLSKICTLDAEFLQFGHNDSYFKFEKDGSNIFLVNSSLVELCNL